jgi:hypothetical protein
MTAEQGKGKEGHAHRVAGRKPRVGATPLPVGTGETGRRV